MIRQKKYLYLLLGIVITLNGQNFDKKISLAMKYFNDAAFSQAYTVFQEVVNLAPKDDISSEVAGYYSAECLLSMNSIEGAISAYGFFIENYRISAFRSSALYKLGILLFQKGNFSGSIEKLITLTNEYPSGQYTGNAYYWIGEAFTADNKINEAKEFLIRAYSSKGDKSYIDYKLFSLAKVYERSGDYKEAVKYYDILLSNYWDSKLTSLAQLRIGICHFYQKDYNSAVLELSDSLIATLPTDVKIKADYLLADSFFKLKEYSDAKRIFEAVINSDELSSDKEQLQYGLGWVNFQMLDYNAAYKIFNSLSKSSDDTLAASSLYWSAECKRYNGETDLAMNILDNYLNKYSRHYLAPTALFNMAIIYYQKENYTRAEEYLVQLTQVEDKDIKSKSYNLLGEISLNRNDYENAQEYFSRAIDLSLMNVNLQNRSKLGLGVALYYQDKYKNAIDALNEINAKYHEFEKDKVNFYLAESYIALGNYDVALRHYLRLNPQANDLAKPILYGKAYSYYNLKDYPNSAYYFNEYAQKYPKDKFYTDSRLRLADSYYAMKDFDRSSQIYDALFNRERKNVDDDFAYYQYGQALFKSGKFGKAIEEFASLQRRFPRSKYTDDSQYIIGWIYFQQNDFEKAIESYKRLFSKYPSSPLRPIAYYSIGDSYFNLAQYDSAVISYNKIIEEFPKTQYVYDAINGIQYCYIAEDAPEKAVSLIDRFVSSNSDYEFSDQILFKKGEIYYSVGDYDRSQNAYKEFLLSFPKSKLVPNAYYWIGKCKQILNNQEAALQNFLNIYENYFNSEYGVSSVIEIGLMKSEEKKYKEVIDLYDAAISKLGESKRTPELKFNRGIALVQNGENLLAYDAFREIINYYAESVFTEKAKIELGILEMENGNYENAELYFNDAGGDRTDDIGAKAQYYYGLALQKQNKTYDAITVFVRVRSVFPGYDEWYTRALIGLGDCYVILGDKKEAREMYRAVLKRHSNDEYSDIANEKIKKL